LALGGSLFYRLLVFGGWIDKQLAEGVADLILRGFAPDESHEIHQDTNGSKSRSIASMIAMQRAAPCAASCSAGENA
jgi:hypothetical protein